MLFHKAYDHAQRARHLLQDDDGSSVTYAALETRMAIEELFYALIPAYRQELPSDIMKSWQPRQVIDALLECDPSVEQYQAVTIRSHNDAKVLFSGQTTPPTRQLLRQYYHKLGSYLHASMQGREHNIPRMRSVLDAALTRIEQHCRETTVILTGALPSIQHRCVCGRILRRNFAAAGLRGYVKCPDEACQAIYDVKLIKGGAKWRLRLVDVPCGRCRVKTPVGVHHLHEGGRFQCIGCGASYRVRIGPISQLESVPAEDGGDGAA